MAAAEGLYLPPAPVGPGGEDSITTSEGVRCSQSINSNGGYLDLGVIGGDLSSYHNEFTPQGQSAAAYARIVVPLGAPPKRLDCSSLYQLEIERLKSEIKLLQMGLE